MILKRFLLFKKRPFCVFHTRSFSENKKQHKKFLLNAYNVFDKSFSHEVNFNNEKIMDLVDIFKSSMLSFEKCQAILETFETTQELQDALYCLKYLPKNNDKLENGIINLLDKFSMQKLENEKIENKVNLCHSWFYSQIQMSQKRNFLTGWRNLGYPKLLTDSCLTQKTQLDSLKAKNFMFILFIASLNRKLPSAKKIAIRDGFHLPELIEQKCIEIWPDLNHEEIGIMASSLYMSNIRLIETNAELCQLFHQALLTVPEDLIGSAKTLTF